MCFGQLAATIPEIRRGYSDILLWTLKELGFLGFAGTMLPTIILHSALVPLSAAEALRRSIDLERRTLFSMSGYKGDRSVLGEVFGQTFRIQRRRYWRNDFAPHFYGTFHWETGGTRIEGHFDVATWVKFFMRFWLGFVAVVGGAMFVLSLLNMTSGSHFITGDLWVGIIVPPALLLFGLVLPRVGRAFGK
ncbi:MAG: hypothetical protein WB707_18660, partial [Candidatus Acidiferrales bacterium]